MRIISFILILLLIILGITFATLNSTVVTVSYYVGESNVPLSLLLVSTLASGGLIGLSIGLWLLLKVKIKNYHLCQRLKLADKEVENLRAIPLQDKH